MQNVKTLQENITLLGSWMRDGNLVCYLHIESSGEDLPNQPGVRPLQKRG